MKTTEVLSPAKFEEIYTNKKFRNEVAFAHGCYDSSGNFKHLKTCAYPHEYIVTVDQATKAIVERERDKEQMIKECKNKLVFIGMGMEYAARYEDDVCNHRIRTEFEAPNGNRYFIELGTMGEEKMRCDHSIDRTKQDQLNDHPNKQSKFYNFAGLERNMYLPKYTLSNVLKLVNEKFGCKFTEIIIDNYTLDTIDLICKSPK